ncbi:hypothetical protein ACQP1P_01305 [Dactylosporangium sp. CA-052675]|uniref:hypothetical protein n=1 Tax=Dactylosporangium sp. CA-052675 TaxID=3239927 RepID=UPI003D94A665
MSNAVPTLLTALVDDAAVFPPGSAPLTDAVPAHAGHRRSWYSELIGPLLLPVADRSAFLALACASHSPDSPAPGGQAPPASPGGAPAGPASHPSDAPASASAPAGAQPGSYAAGLLVAASQAPSAAAADSYAAVSLGLIGEPAALEAAIGDLPACTRQLESPVAKRGEDPLPGIERLARLMRDRREPLQWYVEVPLAWGLMSALDAIAALRAEGLPVAAKFRTGGLAAELFPSPSELAAVIIACRDRDLPFKLTAGLHHAVRHTDAETGLVHHGFVNILAAVLAAADGADPADLAALLSATEAHPLADRVRPHLDRERPLWAGFGSCSVQDPVGDLVALGLLDRPRPKDA